MDDKAFKITWTPTYGTPKVTRVFYGRTKAEAEAKVPKYFDDMHIYTTIELN